MSDPMRELRDAIDAVDVRILAAVNERLALVERLWRLKAELGVDRLDPDRERRIRKALAAANTGPLTPEGVDELVTAQYKAVGKILFRELACRAKPPLRIGDKRAMRQYNCNVRERLIIIQPRFVLAHKAV